MSLKKGAIIVRWAFFHALWPFQRVNKGYLDGYLLHRTCVFKALRLFFLTNIPGPTFIPDSGVRTFCEKLKKQAQSQACVFARHREQYGITH